MVGWCLDGGIAGVKVLDLVEDLGAVSWGGLDW